ncbi:high mobility group B protein 14 [Cinnamomum micranthum f. kanehirae]|uniref:High mobility group B protein 14 n=1 Tax=Cinnamomum micranthum f. kanehirae TaxID=337451 RepID=A0A3S3N577_9MAGN|nr:high mobility group B protein 14 [Cinnamomum micranthum f. kanehirae]
MVKKGKQSRPSSNQSNPKLRNTTKAKAKGKKKVTKSNDSNKPKKPPTAFFYFLVDFRKGYQEEHPEVKSMRDIGKACGEKWKTMTFEEKVQYYDIATEKRADFEKAMIEYVKRQESGEDMEKESDESDIYE